MIIKGFLLNLVILLFVTSTITSQAAQVNFTPVLTLSEEYTDNRFLDHDDDTKVDDYITTAGLSLTTEVLGRTAGMELNYNPSYNTFTDSEDLNYWRHYASLRIYNNFKRNTRLEITSNYLETEDPRDESDETIDDISTEDPAISTDTTRRGRNRTRRNVNELRLTHQYGVRNSLYGAFQHSLYEDTDLPEDGIVDDHQALQPSAGFEHWFSQRWGLAIHTLYSSRDYDDRDDRTESHGSLRIMRSFNRRLSGFIEYKHTILDFDQETDDEDYQLYAPTIGIAYQIGKSTNLTIGAGYYIQDFDQSDNEEGFFVDSKIIHNKTFRTGYIRLYADSGYDVEDSGAQDLGLQIYYEGGIEAGRDFTNRFSGNIYTSYRYDDYPNETLERSDQTFNAGTGISYQALRWMRFQLAYDYQNVTSDIETEEYTENSVILTVTMAPTTPFRLN